MLQKEQWQGFNGRIWREAGPDHNKEFTVEAKIGGKTYAIGKGKTKKGAEQIAAYQTILLLKKRRR